MSALCSYSDNALRPHKYAEDPSLLPMHLSALNSATETDRPACWRVK
jgi:hypothetical protein